VQFIFERNSLKGGAEFVKSIGAPTQNFETQINFREGWDANSGHGGVRASRIQAKTFVRPDVWTG
jgi:hypothetical protein